MFSENQMNEIYYPIFEEWTVENHLHECTGELITHIHLLI